MNFLCPAQAGSQFSATQEELSLFVQAHLEVARFVVDRMSQKLSARCALDAQPEQSAVSESDQLLEEENLQLTHQLLLSLKARLVLQ